MQQIKLFKGIENEIHELEAEVNGWIKESGVTVVSIAGNVAPQTLSPQVSNSGLSTGNSKRYQPSDLFIIVTYEG